MWWTMPETRTRPFTQTYRLSSTTPQMRKRPFIKTAGEVLARSDRLRENLKLEQEMQAQRMGQTAQRKRERSVAR